MSTFAVHHNAISSVPNCLVVVVQGVQRNDSDMLTDGQKTEAVLTEACYYWSVP